MTDFNLTRIDRLRYRPTKDAEGFLGSLRDHLIPGDKATVARLAIGRSVYEGGDPRVGVPTEMGQAIEGIHLFGDDADVWASALCMSVDEPPQDSGSFRQLVEAHWHRGAALLKADHRDAREDDLEFIRALADLLPQTGGISGAGGQIIKESEGEVRLRFGTISEDAQTGEAVTFAVNSPGTSPHAAIMGKTRSGKSRTGLDLASQLVKTGRIPVILIDPKGEFVRDGKLTAKSEWKGGTLDQFFPGIRPIDVPNSPLPFDFLWRRPGASRNDLAKMAIAFRDSFQKCLRVKGDVVLDLLRQAVLELLQTQKTPISLSHIQQAFETICETNEKSPGGIGAKLSEITSLQMFQPKQSPEEFFSNSWVISFGSCSDEPKRLAIFLLFDALSSFLLSLDDSSVGPLGHRSLRQLLVVDEAREILSYKHGALSSLVRKSASKGGVVMLLSQGPDDFDAEEDDFLENMGTVGAFALSSSSVRSLTGPLGRRMKPEEFSDKVLGPGVALVKLPGENARKIVAWR